MIPYPCLSDPCILCGLSMCEKFRESFSVMMLPGLLWAVAGSCAACAANRKPASAHEAVHARLQTLHPRPFSDLGDFPAMTGLLVQFVEIWPWHEENYSRCVFPCSSGMRAEAEFDT